MIERPKSLTELVTEKLANLIINGDLELGGQISEAKIAKDFQVSRTPVREALNRLEMDGLVKVEPQRGTFVFSLESHELTKLCDARTCIETAALSFAIRQNSKGLEEALSHCVGKMEEARGDGDDSRYLRLDTEFHQLMLDFSDNHFLNEAYQAIAQKTSALRNRLGRHPKHMSKSFDEHVAIRDAVKEGDEDKALVILRAHIDKKEGSYWAVI